MSLPPDTDRARVLLERLKAFCLPGGEDGARGIRALKTAQRGEIRSAPGARWMKFTSEEVFEARESSFRWDARFGLVLTVTDAYEAGRGRLVMKLGGLAPIKSFTGPDVDKGELQRYLASVIFCPPALLHNQSLEWGASGGPLLSVRDRNATADAAVELEISPDGRPLSGRAERPRLVGKHTVPTPWYTSGTEFREWEGMRIPCHVEASWGLPDGPFLYYRADITSVATIAV